MRVLISNGITTHREPHDLAVLTGGVTHAPFALLKRAEIMFSCPAIAVAGDMEWDSGTFDRRLGDGLRRSKKIPRLHFLQDSTVEVSGIRFIGSTLWTSSHTRHLTSRSYLLATSAVPFQGATIIVTHHAPGDLLEQCRPDVWIYGEGPDVDERFGTSRLIRASDLVIEVRSS